MTNVDLNKINVLSDKTYLTDKDTWRDYEGNFYESPFNKQTSYGQRYNSKNFPESEMPEEAHNWYEPRQVLGADLSQTRTELGDDELPYHSKFPRYSSRTTETFYTRPFASGQGHAHDVYTSSFPASGPEVPNFVETFKVGKKHFSIVSIVLVIILIIILLKASYYIYKNQKRHEVDNNRSTPQMSRYTSNLERSKPNYQMYGGRGSNENKKKEKPKEKPKKKFFNKFLFDDDYE